MKWTLVSEAREEMIKNAFKGGRGGHRGSSNPSSPSQLNYVNQGPREMAARDGAPSVRKRRVSPSGSPQPRSALRDLQTPIRGSSRRLLPDEPGMGGDGSPLPRIRALGTPKLLPPHMPSRALSIPKSHTDVSDVATDDDHVPRSPTLTSSYGQDESGLSFVTPAPHRVNLRLAPPSTAQRPSQHMPTSSPAPFWRYADIGSTPMRPGALDFSPSRNRLDPVPQSSSPPNKSPDQSPTRRARPSSRDHIKEEQREDPEPLEPVNGKRPGSGQALPPGNDEDDEADGGFDLTKSVSSLSLSLSGDGAFVCRPGKHFANYVLYTGDSKVSGRTTLPWASASKFFLHLETGRPFSFSLPLEKETKKRKETKRKRKKPLHNLC